MTTTRHPVSVAAVVVAMKALAMGVATLIVVVAGSLFPSIRVAQCPLFLYVFVSRLRICPRLRPGLALSVGILPVNR